MRLGRPPGTTGVRPSYVRYKTGKCSYNDYRYYEDWKVYIRPTHNIEWSEYVKLCYEKKINTKVQYLGYNNSVLTPIDRGHRIAQFEVPSGPYAVFDLSEENVMWFDDYEQIVHFIGEEYEEQILRAIKSLELIKVKNYYIVKS